MAFIVLFIAVAFLIPLSAEIYLRGNDNILTRAGREVKASDTYRSLQIVLSRDSLRQRILERMVTSTTELNVYTSGAVGVAVIILIVSATFYIVVFGSSF